jgi:cysteine desulfurase family protein (TIGR01976 family)
MPSQARHAWSEAPRDNIALTTLSAIRPETPPPPVAFPIASARAAFPAVTRAEPFIFFDNAAGAQVPQVAIDEVNRHLLNHNVQRGGRYGKSQEVDRVVDRARARIADFLNADDPREVCLGMNATSFIRLVSLAVGQTLSAGRDEIILTDLDHEANIATWLALEPMGAKFSCWKMREDGVLHVEDLAELLTPRTRMVACNVASNALGSITDVTAAAKLAHAAGAEIFLDAVHYAPHARVNVKAWDCDYLVCSGYKIFAPHMGFLWGKFAALSALPTFREDFIPDEPPYKIEAGTFIYENVAAMSVVIDHLEALGGELGVKNSPKARIAAAMESIAGYEQTLSARMLEGLKAAGAVIYGLSDPARMAERLPTFAFNLPGVAPADLVTRAAAAGIGIRDGHMYAPRLMKRLGLAMDSGAVRASICHYNTMEEVDRFAAFLLAPRG